MSGDKTATELLPCPFCGPGQSMVDPWYDDVSKRWAVGCGRCGSSSGRSIHADGSKEAAIKSWNTRAPAQCDVQTKEALHYLGAIKVRLELLYEHSTQDSRLLEHLSDEVDWVDAEIERLRSSSSPLQSAKSDVQTVELRSLQGAVHLLRKAIHARDPIPELDLRCHDIWTDLEKLAASPLPSAQPLCSCKASARDGQHMAWCPVVTSTVREGQS